jgi:hypothetical protein
MGIPIHSKAYYAERQPFLDKLKAHLEPHWNRFLAKEIDFAKYCELIKPHLNAYSKDPAFQKIWESHGGSKEK